MIADGLKSLAVDIDTVKLMEDNPRRGDVAAVKRSYARFGQVKPIVATPDMTVIAGNHSLIAARELGWTEIAVNVVPFDSEEAKAYALADNRTADLGTYDNEALAELLAEVAVDPELLLATGYDDEAIADLNALLEEIALPIEESTPAGRSAINQESGLARDEPSIGERMEQYQHASIRSVVLDFDLETFDYITKALTALRSEYGVTSNSAVIEHLLRQVMP